jgi:SnoaL-like protein
MTWFSEIGQVIHEAAHLAQLDHLDAAESAVHGGDPTRLLEAFPGGVRIDDPRFGRVEGEADLTEFCKASASWLGERDGRPRPVAVTNGSTRVVGEFDLELSDEGRRFVLPVAVVVEPDRAKSSAWIRTYHSQWPLLGHHVVRSPLLSRDPSATESDVVGEYQAALAAGDADRITATFEPDGCFREPAGPQYRRCGTAVLRDFFSLFFSAGGGIILEHCTVTEDGVRSALEFNAVRWGGHDLPPQAGIAIYERGPSGKLHEARVYDDVEGPVE